MSAHKTAAYASALALLSQPRSRIIRRIVTLSGLMCAFQQEAIELEAENEELKEELAGAKRDVESRDERIRELEERVRGLEVEVELGGEVDGEEGDGAEVMEEDGDGEMNDGEMSPEPVARNASDNSDTTLYNTDIDVDAQSSATSSSPTKTTPPTKICRTCLTTDECDNNPTCASCTRKGLVCTRTYCKQFYYNPQGCNREDCRFVHRENRENEKIGWRVEWAGEGMDVSGEKGN